MKDSFSKKSSTVEIRERFDADVERFSDLDGGQKATIDAPLSMKLITSAAIAATPRIDRCLDIGCGAGNNTIKLLRESGIDFDCDLCDLSGPMLERAEERVRDETGGTVRVFRGDFRELLFSQGSYDVVLAAAVLHHLRDDEDWESVFRKVFELLRPGGSFWITDLVVQEIEPIDDLMWGRYAEYLEGLGGKEYRDEVLAYIGKEDSPRPITYQLELMKRVGFEQTEILHKNACFAAFGGVKGL